MADPETIAKGLTKAQKRWLLAAAPTLEAVPKKPCATWWDSPRLYVKIDGDRHWLGSKGMTSPEGSPEFTEGYERLTPLGLEVRAILKDPPNV